jgi:hypothetical protein
MIAGEQHGLNISFMQQSDGVNGIVFNLILQQNLSERAAVPQGDDDRLTWLVCRAIRGAADENAVLADLCPDAHASF